MRLRDIAHARAGDKGAFVTLSLTPYDLGDYEDLKARVSAQYVADSLGWLFPKGVRRFEVDNVSSLQFVGERAAADNVVLSLAMDRHGKSISALFLDLPYPAPTAA